MAIGTFKYETFAAEVEQKVAVMTWRPGQPLPSIRRLMSSNRISLATVVKGLNLLEKRGVVNRHQGRGYFIADRQRPHPGVGQIAFVTASLERDTNHYLKGFAGALDVNRFALATYASHGELKNFQSLVEQVVRTRPAGIILQSVPEDLFAFDAMALANAGIPVVVMGPAMKGLSCDRVMGLGREHGRKITRYLLGRGRQDYAMLTMNPLDDPDCVFNGVRLELRAAGIELADDRIFACKPLHGFATPTDPYIDAYQAMKRVLAGGVRFKTLICCHDYPAVGALRAIREAGLRVPEEIAVASGIRCGVEGATPMKLTTVDHHRQEQARIATELLLRRIDGDDAPSEVHYVNGDVIPGQTA